MQDILQAISTVGFPIAAAIYVTYLNHKQSEDFNNRIDKQNESHEREIKELTEAINNNTKVITILTERIDK